MADKNDFKFYVIGTGLPRTGTSSLKIALEKLLPGRCQHMIDVLQSPDHYINNVLLENTSDESFKDYFVKQNFVAAVDIPFILVYKRAMKLFPNAKFILTVRSEKTWIKSMIKTVCVEYGKNNMYNKFPNYLFFWFYPQRKRLIQFLKSFTVVQNMIQSVEEGNGIEFYNEWVKDIKSSIPEDRLLVFNVKQGWEPLCEFLHVPIPDVPFPKTDGSKEFNARLRKQKMISWFTLFVVTGVPIATAIGIGFYLK